MLRGPGGLVGRVMLPVQNAEADSVSLNGKQLASRAREMHAVGMGAVEAHAHMVFDRCVENPYFLSLKVLNFYYLI